MKYLSLLLLAFCLMAFSHTEKKADRLFARWEYCEAAKLYEKEAAKNPTADVYYKLGECYRKMNSKKQEQVADDKVNSYGPYSKPVFYLNYGQVLKSNGRNEDAEAAFKKYAELVPSDPAGIFYSESIEIVETDHQFDEPITVSNVKSINSESADLAPVFYKDGIVFTSSRKTEGHEKTYPWTGSSYLDLYYAKKGANDSVFTDVAPFGGKEINKKYHDGPACFSKNFDTIYVSRVEKYLKGEDKKTLGIERNKMFYSTLEEDGDWTKSTPMAFNSDSYSVANPFLTKDGSRLYFVSDMPGGMGETDIYYCNRVNGAWSAPINIGPNVNTFNREKYPSVDEDGNFYFSSNGYQGFGGMDICVALNNNGVLAKAIPMKAPFNSSYDDFGIIFLKDGKTGYISSNRAAGGQGEDDILYFDLNRDKVDSTLETSVYTIGYRPKPKTVIEVAEVVPDVVKPFVIVNVVAPIEGTIYFDYNKSVIRPDAISYLDSVATYMKQYPEMTIVMGGHCDERGTAAYNLKLSNERNDAAIKYLVSKGISRKRIVPTGYGWTKIVNGCINGAVCTEPQHQVNRKVEFHFVKNTASTK